MAFMFYPDLTPYVFLEYSPDPNLLNVGWLDEHHDFPKGKVPPALLDRLLELCANPVRTTRGYHQTPLIKSYRYGYPVIYGNREIVLGSAEIRVPGKGGIIYACPNLIYLYMRDCSYLPPDEFLAAVNSL